MDSFNQWSIKLNNGEIYMIQRPSIDELEKARGEIMGVISIPQEKPPVESLVTPQEYYVREVKKEGPNKGKHFKVAKGKDGAFLGWTDEPLT